MTGTVIYSQQDAVAVVAMNRPEALNGFTSELCSELVLAFERAQRDESVRAVVFTGEGRAFSAGADLKEGFVGERSTQGRLLFEYGPVLSAIANIPKPVIAAVPGFAAGIGMSFAMHSDLLVMAEESFLLSPFTTIGLMPDGGANWLLVRQLGYHRAYQLSIESERISAERCEELGIANRVVPAAELMDNAVEWGNALAKRAPLSLAATKKVMRYAMDNDWHSCYTMEAEQQEKLRATSDNEEGVSAFFEKREPNFTGE
jgi:2-(1,2-epoxy-1,2-dihydrophenyl)acetyl-CoA isomerase